MVLVLISESGCWIYKIIFRSLLLLFIFKNFYFCCGNCGAEDFQAKKVLKQPRTENSVKLTNQVADDLKKRNALHILVLFLCMPYIVFL